MKLTTDVAIRKWKPKSEGERVSCGQSLYVQGYSNGKRSWVYRLQYFSGNTKKSLWLTIGYPTAGAEHAIAGGSLRLAEARELAICINSAVKRGEASADQIKRTLLSPFPIIEFEERLLKSTFVPVVEEDFSKIPTFDEMFMKWYKLQMASKRWTHFASIRRPVDAHEKHAKKAFKYMLITDITRRVVFGTIEKVFLEHHKTAKDLHCYVDEVFELDIDLEIISHNPCPPKKKFTKPKRKVAHHGTIASSRLPDLYQHVVNGKSDATFKAAAIALIVSGLRVSNIAMLRQKHYDPKTGQFTIPEKTNDTEMLGLMKTGGKYSNIFPAEVRDIINVQMVEDHEYVFVSRYNGRHINPESLRKNFKQFDPNITSHGFRNCFKEWGYNNKVDKFLVDRYCDHILQGLDASYRRFDTLEARADIARRYYAYMVTGKTPAPRQQPLLEAVA